MRKEVITKLNNVQLKLIMDYNLLVDLSAGNNNKGLKLLVNDLNKQINNIKAVQEELKADE